MKYLFIVIALTIATSSFALGQSASVKITGKHNPKDEAAIEKVVLNADEGWVKRDAKVALTEYADDAYWINAFGIERQGRPAIEKFITAIFAKPGFRAAKVTPAIIVSITFIKPDVASVHTFGQSVGQLTDSGKAMTPRKTHIFRIMTKHKGEWLTDSFQVMDEKERVP